MNKLGRKRLTGELGKDRDKFNEIENKLMACFGCGCAWEIR